MKNIAILILMLFVNACTTAPRESDPELGPDVVYPPPTIQKAPLQDRLGMRRSADDLGYAEKQFNDCAQTGTCRSQYFSVVHFQLLCRDSEGTVSNVPLHLKPLTSNRVSWKLGNLTGLTGTDTQGFGQFSVVSDQSTRGQRLILRIGKQLMGFTVSEVSKVVLPQNFCI